MCIHFRRAGFKTAMQAANVKVNKMTYLKLGQLEVGTFPVEEPPFLKRIALEDEGEIRAVYENKAREQELKQVDIDFSIIEKVTLNPWMPKSVADSVRTTIESLRKAADFTVTQSSLVARRCARLAGLRRTIRQARPRVNTGARVPRN